MTLPRLFNSSSMRRIWVSPETSFWARVGAGSREISSRTPNPIAGAGAAARRNDRRNLTRISLDVILAARKRRAVLDRKLDDRADLLCFLGGVGISDFRNYQLP